MKNLMKITLLVALAAMMTGCVQMHMDTEIKKDGSGTLDMTLSLSKAVTEVLQDDVGDDDLKEIGKIIQMDKKDLEKKIKGHGVKIKKFSTDMVDGRETVHVIMEFKDIEGMSYAISQIQGGSEGSGGMAIIDIGDGQYALRTYTYDWPVVEAEVEEEEAEEEMSMDDMDPEKMQKQMESMGKLMGAMGELDFSMKITVPGDIVSSNAPLTEGRTSIWTINASNMMTAGGDMEPNIVFSSKGLKIKNLK